MLASALRWLAMAALVAMMGVTVLDIAMRNVLNQLVLGSIELVQLTIVLVVFLALPETFLRKEQITVDAIDQFVSPRVAALLRALAALATVCLMLVMLARMVPLATDTRVTGDLTTDLQISLFWFWLPILVGIGASVLTMLVVSFDELRTAWTQAKSAPHEP